MGISAVLLPNISIGIEPKKSNISWALNIITFACKTSLTNNKTISHKC